MAHTHTTHLTSLKHPSQSLYPTHPYSQHRLPHHPLRAIRVSSPQPCPTESHHRISCVAQKPACKRAPPIFTTQKTSRSTHPTTSRKASNPAVSYPAGDNTRKPRQAGQGLGHLALAPSYARRHSWRKAGKTLRQGHFSPSPPRGTSAGWGGALADESRKEKTRRSD